MKSFLKFISILVFWITLPYFVYAAVFNSAQVGTSPVNGYILQTNGSISTWVANSAGGGSGTVSTSTNEIAGRLPYWTSNSGTPALLGQVATGTASCNSPLSCSNFTVIGSSPTLQLGTVGVANGGTGATTFGQGWINSSGGTTALSASTSPTVNYIVATSTTKASIFPMASTTELSVVNDFKIGNTIPLQLSPFGGTVTQFQMDGSVNDGLGMNIFNRNTGSFAVSYIALNNSNTTLNIAGASAAYTCNWVMGGGGWNGVPLGFGSLKANDSAMYCTDGNYIIGAATSSPSHNVGNVDVYTGFSGSFNSGIPDFRFSDLGYFSIGSSTPYANLVVNGFNKTAGMPLFVIASSSQNLATTTMFSVVNNSVVLGNNAVVQEYNSGSTTISHPETGNWSFDNDAGRVNAFDLPIVNSSKGTVQSYSFNLNGSSTPTMTIYGESNGAGGAQNQRAAVGSTSPWATFSVVSMQSATTTIVHGDPTHPSCDQYYSVKLGTAYRTYMSDAGALTTEAGNCAP